MKNLTQEQIEKRKLAKKLAAHRFTVVAQAQENDPDVAAYRRKEMIAKKRAKKRAEIDASKKVIGKGGLVIKINEKRLNKMQEAFLKAS